MNTYFINIGREIGGEFSYKNKVGSEGTEGSDGATADGWAFSELNEAEVMKVVKSINVSKSSGLNNISSFVVKEVFSILISQLTHLFNLTIRTSIFPKAWKEALVIPIPKSGNAKHVQNYRPISLLPLPGKLLEKLIHSQISEHLENISHLTENQHGFRKGHSTIHSVAQVTDYINIKMDRRLPTLAAFIDFRKAFDCVQHPVLLDKLSALGLNGKVIDWFTSYLENRRQRVLANDTYSSWQHVTQGVPQGSVLGPPFYILYANDIIERVKFCNIALYADDTLLYLANPNFNDTIKKLQDDMNSLSSWCDENGIQMNVDKMNIMFFGSQCTVKKLPDFEIVVNETPVKLVPNYRYLGITLDGQLNYNKHVQKTINRVTLKLKQMRRMRSFLDTRAATLVYKNMILPILEYGDIFMVGASAENRKRLQVLQNKGLRCALDKDTDTSITDLHRSARLLKLKDRRGVHLLSHMYDQAQRGKNLKEKKKGGGTNPYAKQKISENQKTLN